MNSLGRLYAKTGEPGKAVQALERLEKQDPELADELRSMLKRRDSSQAYRTPR